SALVRVVDKMMAKDAAQRYQTPAEVADALTRIASSATATHARVRFNRRVLVSVAAIGVAALLFAFIYFVVTDDGQLIIQSRVDDVQVVLAKGGKEIEVIDLKNGSTVKRLRSGDYDIKLKGERTDLTLDKGGFTMKRMGHEIVRVSKVEGRAAAAATAGGQ